MKDDSTSGNRVSRDAFNWDRAGEEAGKGAGVYAWECVCVHVGMKGEDMQ